MSDEDSTLCSCGSLPARLVSSKLRLILLMSSVRIAEDKLFSSRRSRMYIILSPIILYPVFSIPHPAVCVLKISTATALTIRLLSKLGQGPSGRGFWPSQVYFRHSLKPHQVPGEMQARHKE